MFLLSRQYSLVKVREEDIHHIIAEGRYTTIHSTKGKFVTQQSLSKWKSMLEQDLFVQINRKTLIRFNCLEEIIPRDNLIVLDDESTHTLGRQYKENLMQCFVRIV